MSQPEGHEPAAERAEISASGSNGREAYVIVMLHLLMILTAGAAGTGVDAAGPTSRGASDLDPTTEVVTAVALPASFSREHLLIDPEQRLANYRNLGVRHCPTDLASTSVDALMAIQPLSSGIADISVQKNLRVAFATAMRKIHAFPACEALFAERGHDGRVLLATTVYLGAGTPDEQEVCASGAAAFTSVGMPVTYLCPAFSHRSPQEGAMYLLHEALHYAGQTEYPSDPLALTSNAINRLVRSRCGL